ncbi:MAG: CotH kinase family protein, partial [Anaerolineales bacterium]
IRNWFNGQPIGMHGLLQPVDRDFITAWYGDPGNSVVLKVEGRRAFTDAGTLLGWDGASFIYRTDSKEDYRDYFIQGIRRSADLWDQLIGLCKVMDRRASPNPAFDEKIDSVLDTEAFLRGFAPRVLQSDWDAFCVGNGHNGYLVIDPRDQRWELLPFDMDNTFSNPSINFYPASDPDVARLLSRPAQRRLYFRILSEYIGGYWSSARAGPYLDALQKATAIGFTGIKSYLTTTSAQVRNLIQSSTTSPFRIVTNDGKDITTGAARIELTGDAPIQVVQVFHHRNDEDFEPLAPAWTSPVRWLASFDLPEAENRFEFLAFDAAGNLTHEARIAVRTTAHLPPPAL